MTKFNRDTARFLICYAGIFCVLSAASAALAQSSVRRIDFNSPEAWALKYFTSASTMSGLQTPEGQRLGSVTIGIESGWLPKLSAEQQRVGWNGTKPEDLNKAPLFVRPRVRVVLPWKFAVTAAVTPPIRAFGIKPELFAAALERPILLRDTWSLGWRVSGQVGSVEGAFTCPRSALAFPPGSPNNLSGCDAESSDVSSLRYAGGELHLAHRITKLRGLTPHVAGGINYIDGAFQVNSVSRGRLDRTKLLTRGKTFSVSAGAAYPLTQRIALAIDVFYSPLWVKRNIDAPLTNDGLFNVRALVTYRLR